MSLGRLLAAGKSLIGLRNGESRYREDKRARLPKFISPKNPFASGEKAAEPRAAVAAATAPVVAPEPARPVVVAVETPTPVLPVVAEVPAPLPVMETPVVAIASVATETPVAVSELIETPKLEQTSQLIETPKPVEVTKVTETPKVAPAPVRLEALAAAAPKRVVTPKPPKAARLSGLLGGLGKKLNPFASREPKPSAPAPRQVELALDRVQVVRNDLSDADVETVPVSTAGKLSVPLVSAAREKLEPVGAAWNRVTTKFLGTDQP